MTKLKTVAIAAVASLFSVIGYIAFDNVLTPDAVVIESVEGTLLYDGVFTDADPAHKAKGSFSIVSDGMGGRSIMLGNDFEVANAPDPHVYINGEKIAKNFWKGGQVFNVPNYISEDISEVKIFCEIAGINLAVSTFIKK